MVSNACTEVSTVKRRNKNRLYVFTMLALLMVMLINVSGVFAETKADATADEQAKKQLTSYVYGQMSQNEYEVDGGGSIQGADLFEGSPSDGYDLDEDAFQTMTSKAQTEAVSDIATLSNEAVGSDKADGVTESTVTNWWKELQQKNGVGSKFMNEILKNTKPDFVAANKIYQPFSGPISIAIGVVVVLLMAFLGLSMAADIAYITLPPVRMLVADGEGDGKPQKSKIFTYDAIYAVRAVEEESDNARGGGKQALGIYLKRRIVALILLGICLLYLVQGQLYTAVGWILDLVSGFLGF